jgi:hypothetical protein
MTLLDIITAIIDIIGAILMSSDKFRKSNFVLGVSILIIISSIYLAISSASKL